MAGISFPGPIYQAFTENVDRQQFVVPVWFLSYSNYPFDYLYPTADGSTSYPQIVSVSIGGVDAAKFRLDSSPSYYSYFSQKSSQGPSYAIWDVPLIQVEPFDYEAPSDANRDGKYEISITVVDNAGNTATSDPLVAYLTDVVEPVTSSTTNRSIDPVVGATTRTQPAASLPDPITNSSAAPQSSVNDFGGVAYDVPFGRSGSWKLFRKTKGSDLLWDFEKRKRKGKKIQYALVDNDVKVISGFNPDVDSIRLAGNWENYYIAPFINGTIISVGSNIVASVDVEYSRAQAGLNFESF